MGYVNHVVVPVVVLPYGSVCTCSCLWSYYDRGLVESTPYNIPGTRYEIVCGMRYAAYKYAVCVFQIPSVPSSKAHGSGMQ